MDILDDYVEGLAREPCIGVCIFPEKSIKHLLLIRNLDLNSCNLGVATQRGLMVVCLPVTQFH